MNYRPIDETEEYQRAQRILETGWGFVQVAAIFWAGTFIILFLPNKIMAVVSGALAIASSLIAEVYRKKGNAILRSIPKRDNNVRGSDSGSETN